MKRFTSFAFSISALSVLLVAGTIAPSAQAKPKSGSTFNLQALRMREFDARNKSEEEPTFKLQTLRMREFDARNKSEDKPTFNLQALRMRELDARNKSEEEPTFNLQTLRMREFDARNKSGYEQPYYPYGQPQVQTPAQASPQPASTTPSVESADPIEADLTTVGEEAEQPNTASSQGLSLTEQRHQQLDRS